MSNNIKCKSCFRKISGKICIDTYKKKLGKKVLEQVDYYCEKCFKILKIERAWDVYRKEERICKKKNSKRTRRKST